MNDNKLIRLSFDFSVSIINAFKDLQESKREFIISKQLLRSATSIGANIREAQYAQSKADFINKLQIALKEANEAEYWLELLMSTDYIEQSLYTDLASLCKEIKVTLIKSIKTAKSAT